jgi:hypothetical protein
MGSAVNMVTGDEVAIGKITLEQELPLRGLPFRRAGLLAFVAAACPDRGRSRRGTLGGRVPSGGHGSLTA